MKTGISFNGLFLTTMLVSFSRTVSAGEEEQPVGKGCAAFEAGPSLQQDVTLHTGDNAKASFNPGFRFNLALGGYSSRGLGAEFDFGLVYNSMKPIYDPYTFESTGIDVYQIPMLINITYHLPLKGPVSIYGGFGIGAVYEIYAGRDTGLFGFNTELVFGYQGTFGVKYAVSPNCELGIAYRFLGTSEHDFGRFKSDGTLNHSFLATLTFNF
jgi:opacity protein-like surface antigen